MTNLLDRLYKWQGKYIIEDVYLGKTKYNIILQAAKKLYEDTLHLSLLEITKHWGQEVSQAAKDMQVSKLLESVGGMDAGMNETAVQHIWAKCYEYVVAKRYNTEYGVDLRK